VIQLAGRYVLGHREASSIELKGAQVAGRRGGDAQQHPLTSERQESPMQHAHHAHEHHAHPNPQAHAHEHDAPYSARKHPEFVVLDIGAQVGALIVHADPELHGVEVEISPTGEDGRRSHKEVLERAINGRPAFTAVFDHLPAGTYTLWTGGDPRARAIAISGGSIAELDWRTANR
jgi:hypothetical protein